MRAHTRRDTVVGETPCGLGTDLGGPAMGYRTDLLATAKLPTDPARAGAPARETFLETSVQFKAANTGAASA